MRAYAPDAKDGNGKSHTTAYAGQVETKKSSKRQ